jgi:hypothetical protein
VADTTSSLEWMRETYPRGGGEMAFGRMTGKHTTGANPKAKLSKSPPLPEQTTAAGFSFRPPRPQEHMTSYNAEKERARHRFSTRNGKAMSVKAMAQKGMKQYDNQKE